MIDKDLILEFINHHSPGKNVEEIKTVITSKTQDNGEELIVNCKRLHMTPMSPTGFPESIWDTCIINKKAYENFVNNKNAIKWK
jgi:hypothetical protein